jgi:hypothetical protein
MEAVFAGVAVFLSDLGKDSLNSSIFIYYIGLIA